MLFLNQPRFGPSYKFDDTDLFTILDLLHVGKRVGRGRISNHLDLGEGSTRKLVELMRDYDMLKIEQPGITITRFGRKVYDLTGMRLVDINVPGHVIGECQTGVVIKNVADKVGEGIEQRNTGIKTGGYGCTTWFVRNGDLIMAPGWNMHEENPELACEIMDKCELEEGDTLIVGGADSVRKARVSAVSAALDMFRVT